MKFKYNDVEMYYEIIGEGIPLLLIHGYMIDHTVMKHSFEELALDNFKRIYIDLPHMGNSNRPESVRSSDDYLNVLSAFVDEVIQEPFVVCGFSYGGYLARALEMKKEVLGSLLICPVIEPTRSKRKLPKHQILEQDEYVQNYKGDIEDYLEMAVVQTEYTLKRYFSDFVEAFSKANSEVLVPLIRERYPFTFDINQTIQTPMLLLAGAQDSVVGYEDFFQYIHFYERPSFVVLDKAGHSLMTEQRELFKHHVETFLEDLWKR